MCAKFENHCFIKFVSFYVAFLSSGPREARQVAWWSSWDYFRPLSAPKPTPPLSHSHRLNLLTLILN